MAAPRVFISSTCYDLSEERDGLADYCSSYGFETSLSERGDIFYHPDLHTHLSCVRETGNCHLFILIIGGRFGGKYKVDPTKSITNAEYSAAVESGIPTFTFVKQEVLNDQNVWQRNKDLAHANLIQFPSIEKQEHAEQIFNFIDSVRQAPVNNGIFGFRVARDIHDALRKQWAGMMFDYLQNRNINKQLAMTNDALGNLAVVSGKIEELVKSMYRQVDEDRADEKIQTIEEESTADEFLQSAASLLGDLKFLSEQRLKIWAVTSSRPPDRWWDFLATFGYNKVSFENDEKGETTQVLLSPSDKPILKLGGLLSKSEEVRLQNFARGYEAFKALGQEVQTKLMSKYLWTKADSDAWEKARDAGNVKRSPGTAPS